MTHFSLSHTSFVPATGTVCTSYRYNMHLDKARNSSQFPKKKDEKRTLAFLRLHHAEVVASTPLQFAAIKRYRSRLKPLFEHEITMAKLTEYLWIAILGGILGFVYGFLIGANDVANAFASSIASKSITLKQAVRKSYAS